jgi:hypothetical protein
MQKINLFRSLTKISTLFDLEPLFFAEDVNTIIMVFIKKTTTLQLCGNKVMPQAEMPLLLLCNTVYVHPAECKL